MLKPSSSGSGVVAFEGDVGLVFVVEMVCLVVFELVVGCMVVDCLAVAWLVVAWLVMAWLVMA